MKEVLLGALFMVVLGSSMMIVAASCEGQPEVKQEPQEPQELTKGPTDNYYLKVTEYTYEGCEYIKVGYGKSIWGSHKGNCNNPIHKGQHPSPYTFDIPEQKISDEN